MQAAKTVLVLREQAQQVHRLVMTKHGAHDSKQKAALTAAMPASKR
jgi:hypothetical protein